MRKVAIIDYNCGNIFSLSNALKRINQPFDLVDKATSLSQYDHAILPGVGSFGPAINHLVDMGFDDELREFVVKERSIFGICLGMQLLLSKSYENGVHNGISLIKGTVEKIPYVDPQERIPNIGWSCVNKNPTSFTKKIIFDLHNSEHQYYFVHSYQAIPNHSDEIISRVNFGHIELTAAIGNEYIFGVQFHPEKSGKDGLELLKRIQLNYWT